MIEMSLRRVELPLEHPFTISRGTMTTQCSLYVELQHEGVTGLGEVTENSYYGHTFESIEASLEKARPLLGRYLDEKPVDVWADMEQALGNDRFALSALDIAAHDLRGKRLGVPTWKDWGLEWNQVVPSSFTIGIDSIEKMVAKLGEKPGWPVYKIKLGTDRDLDIIRELRQHTDARFRVDANCGWTVDQAIEYSAELAALGVEFIEQPLAAETETHDKRKLFENSRLPLIADEDCLVESDVARCEGLYHGVNVKICKCGGLTPALNMLRHARSLGMKTMVGCMVESSVGISGAAQLLPLLDYADLDGAILLGDEPVDGVSIEQGVVGCPTGAGCGAQINESRMGQFQTSSQS